MKYKSLKSKEEVLEHIASKGFDPKKFEIYFNGESPEGRKRINNRLRKTALAWMSFEEDKFIITSPKGYFKEDDLDHELGHAKFKSFPKIESALRWAELPWKISSLFGPLGQVGYLTATYFAALNSIYGWSLLIPAISHIVNESAAEYYGYKMKGVNKSY